MRKSISIGTGAAAAAVLTHGIVFSSVNFNETLPDSAYGSLFRQILLVTERLWSAAHGWPSMSHIRNFGGFYAPLVQVLCPLLGFALFWAMSRHAVGRNCWKPVAIALGLAIPNGYIELVSASSLPWVEMVRTAVIVWLMAWSVGASRVGDPRHRWVTSPVVR